MTNKTPDTGTSKNESVELDEADLDGVAGGFDNKTCNLAKGTKVSDRAPGDIRETKEGFLLPCRSMNSSKEDIDFIKGK